MISTEVTTFCFLLDKLLVFAEIATAEISNILKVCVTQTGSPSPHHSTLRFVTFFRPLPHIKCYGIFVCSLRAHSSSILETPFSFLPSPTVVSLVTELHNLTLIFYLYSADWVRFLLKDLTSGNLILHLPLLSLVVYRIQKEIFGRYCLNKRTFGI